MRSLHNPGQKKFTKTFSTINDAYFTPANNLLKVYEQQFTICYTQKFT